MIEKRGGTLVVLKEADRRRVLALRRDPIMASLKAARDDEARPQPAWSSVSAAT